MRTCQSATQASICVDWLTSYLETAKVLFFPKTFLNVSFLTVSILSLKKKKIASSRSKFDSQPADDIPTLHSFVGSGRCGCEPVSKGLVRKRICDSALKICVLDSVLTTWLKTYLDDLVPLICRIVNESLLSGLVPLQFKEAVANAPPPPSPAHPPPRTPFCGKKALALQICVSFAVSLQTAREDCPASDSEPFADQQCLW